MKTDDGGRQSGDSKEFFSACHPQRRLIRLLNMAIERPDGADVVAPVPVVVARWRSVFAVNLTASQMAESR